MCEIIIIYKFYTVHFKKEKKLTVVIPTWKVTGNPIPYGICLCQKRHAITFMGNRAQLTYFLIF